LIETAKELGINWEGIISFDLMLIYRSFGIKGGLKKIKENLGITHPILKDVNGASAPTLWQKYIEGD
jgi:tRNA A37 N6-isopentenylltransferase MiaA